MKKPENKQDIQEFDEEFLDILDDAFNNLLRAISILVYLGVISLSSLIIFVIYSIL